MNPYVFTPFPKISRLWREVVVTEKIDGTNAQIVVTESGEVLAGSRTRFVTPESDNFGFAAWVKAHETELRDGLGVGQHFGEWWGRGIQRGYGLKERRFSLFNTARWGEVRPECCHVVPVLWAGVFDTEEIFSAEMRLRVEGSLAAPGFDKPEGIVIYHTASNQCFKSTLDGDAAKGAAA